MPKAKKASKLHAMRHSCAHVMAAAVCHLYPKTKLAIGPPIEDGFYYDFELAQVISEKDFPRIEEEMRRIIGQNLSFEKFEMGINQALKKEKEANQPYKIELIEELKERGFGKVSYFRTGDFVDLCEGPHVKTTRDIGPFKLLSVAGAYWRGSEENPMLARIYGTVFETQKDLDAYLKNLEEAKLRDHRKLGKELELFAFSEEIGPGLVLWLPRGTIIKEEVEKLGKEMEEKDGYERISTPHIAKESLYHTSGHLPYFQDEMYPPMITDEGNYYLKPMNCPHTHMIFKAKKRSYRELPIRYSEFGTVYRMEKSGELTGLLRVRGMTQNDAHIYCDEDDVLRELISVMNLHKYYYDLFDIKDYWIELALPDFERKKDKYFDEPKGWEKAIKLLRLAAKDAKVEFVEEKGAAAFYGPKFDFNIKSAIGRSFGASTNQLDFGSAARFGLTYVDKSGKEKVVPYIIHRAPLGSNERFVGFLIEHFGGAFPTWLSPVQIVIIPISQKHEAYAKKVHRLLTEEGIRTQIDERSQTLQAKIRDASLQKIPYMGIVGDREKKAKTITVRGRGGEDFGQKRLADFLIYLQKEINEKRGIKEE